MLIGMRMDKQKELSGTRGDVRFPLILRIFIAKQHTLKVRFEYRGVYIPITQTSSSITKRVSAHGFG